MNRTIKFRAWDGKVVFMISSLDWDRETQQMVAREHSLDKPWVLMQFTGLLDKNGKEIYEGDVIQWRETNGALQKEEIVWDDELSAFMCRNPELMNRFFGGVKRNHLEIIGNIWENPELL